MKTIGSLLSNEGINAGAVLALSGTLMALVANGPGLVSLGRMVSGALSNPIPKAAAATRRSYTIPAPRQQAAA